MSLHTHAKRYEQIDAFLGRPSTHGQDDACLDRFLDYDHERSSPSRAVPLEEIEERLELAKDVQDHIYGPLHGQESDSQLKDRQLTAFQLSVLMVMPLEKLRGLRPSNLQFTEFAELVKIRMYPPP